MPSQWKTPPAGSAAPVRPPRSPRRAHRRLETGVIAMVLLGVGLLLGNADSAPAAPGPASAGVDTQTVSPQQAKAGVLPPDGPAPDQPPFGVDAQALLSEVRSHSVPLADTDSQRLVDVGDRAIARGQPDLSADDVAIDQDLRHSFPGWTDRQYADARRCLAEYAERVIARNNHTVPPDSDDHNN